MFDHLSHILGVIGAGLTGLLLILGRRKAASKSVASEAPPPPITSVPQTSSDGITIRAAAELVGHEAIVQEAYKDSEGIWTWGIGVTDASGHKVSRYIDHPQSVMFCLQIYVWLLRTKYLPAVLRAFRGHTLTEAQLAAALSFHYNTGAIDHASWVTLWKAGQIAAAQASFMTWDHPSAIVPRRQKECDLFFNGTWSGDGYGVVYPVLKPSYHPDFRHPIKVDLLKPLHQVMGGP